mgnify:CR=1 FL=1
MRAPARNTRERRPASLGLGMAAGCPCLCSLSLALSSLLSLRSSSRSRRPSSPPRSHTKPPLPSLCASLFLNLKLRSPNPSSTRSPSRSCTSPSSSRWWPPRPSCTRRSSRLCSRWRTRRTRPASERRETEQRKEGSPRGWSARNENCPRPRAPTLALALSLERALYLFSFVAGVVLFKECVIIVALLCVGEGAVALPACV